MNENFLPSCLSSVLLLRSIKSQALCLSNATEVSQEEADQVHKMLEEFRDEANEEKVLRRLNMKRAASEGVDLPYKRYRLKWRIVMMLSGRNDISLNLN